MNTITKLTAAMICALALAACGGGGSDSAGCTGDSTSACAVDPGDTGDGGVAASYLVTPSVSGSGGTINRSDPVPVLPGATTSFTLQPNSGYTVSVSGTCGGTLGSNNVYTTNAINKDCTVVATFTLST